MVVLAGAVSIVIGGDSLACGRGGHSCGGGHHLLHHGGGCGGSGGGCASCGASSGSCASCGAAASCPASGGCASGQCAADARPAYADVATLVVNLPADARLTIDDYVAQSVSASRTFNSPALEQGKDFHYTLKAEVVRDGQTLSVVKEVTVRAGEVSQVSLEMPTSVASAS